MTPLETVLAILVAGLGLLLLRSRGARRAEGHAPVARELAVARPSAEDGRGQLDGLRERGAAVVRSSADAIVSTDLDGTVTTWNRGAETILGYSAEEILGKYGDVLWVDPSLARELLSRVRSGQDVVSREVGARKRDGTTALVSVTLSPLRDERGEIVGLSTVAQDVTERNRLEAARRQRQKLEALGTLAGGIAHDFNNLLWVILGNAQLAQRAVGVGSPAAGSLEQIVEASRRASELVDRILSFARPAAAAPHPIDLGRIVEEGAGLLRTTAPSGVRITTDLRAPAPWVEAEPAQLSQIVMNLGTNALASLGGEGSLSFRLSEWAPGLGRDGGLRVPAVLLEVTDSGAGIDPEHLDRIFDPFFTTRGVGRGSGLGLAIVQGIVTALGGEIELSTAVGQGSSFRIRLPRSEAPVATACEPAPPPEAASPAGRGEELLVVDDDPQVLALLESLLVDAGYTVRALSDPLAAFGVFAAEPDRFRLVVADVVMPALSGRELIVRMRALRPDLSALLLSGYHDPLEETPFPAGVLRKPIEASALVARVNELLGELDASAIERSGRPSLQSIR